MVLVRSLGWGSSRPGTQERRSSAALPAGAEADRQSGQLQESGVAGSEGSGDSRGERSFDPAAIGPSSSDVDPVPDDLVARLRERLFAAQERFVIERTLWELVGIGTPEAIGVVLECMTSGPDFPDEGRFFAELLADVEDERIAPTARFVLSDHLAVGESSWKENGYCELLARHGGPAEHALLLEIVGQPELEQVREGALWALFTHGPEGIENELLGLLPDLYRAGDGPLGALLLRGVLEDADPGLRAAVWDVANDPDMDGFSRMSTIEALAGSARGAEDVRELVEAYADAENGGRWGLLPNLGRALRNVREEERERARTWILPVLREALASGDRGLVASAIALIKQDPQTLVEPLRAELARLRADELSDTARTALRELGF